MKPPRVDSLVQLLGVTSDLYKEENGYYSHIYRDTNAQVLADLLRIDNSYKAYMNTNESRATPNPVLTRNARTYALASVALLSLFVQKGDAIVDISDIENNEQKQKTLTKSIETLWTLFPVKKDNEDELLFALFGVLSTDVFSVCFDNAKDVNPELDESNYLKKKDTYFKMMKRINSQYHRSGSSDLRKAAELLFCTQNQ